MLCKYIKLLHLRCIFFLGVVGFDSVRFFVISRMLGDHYVYLRYESRLLFARSRRFVDQSRHFMTKGTCTQSVFLS